MAGTSRRYPMLRRSRAMWGSRRVWQPRLVFWAGALGIGVISVLFAVLADRAQELFHLMTGDAGGWRFYLPLAVTPLGFVLCAWLAHTFFPGSQGSGIPQAIAARHLRDDEDRSHILSLKLVVGKIMLTIVGLFCGASIGREGPTVQVGASLMLQAARWGGMVQARGLILAGSAAGIAAAFNTPLAGIVFAIEEMGRTYEARTNGLVLTAVILAGLASLGLLGNYTYFGVAKDTISFAAEWPLVIACGVIGGGLGALFSLLALKATRRIRRWNTGQPLRRALLVAAVCGLLVAVIGIASGGLTFGTGYMQARGAVEGTPLPWFFFAEKFLAGLLSMISGIPGGIFAPSLAVGAGIGSSLGLLFGASTGAAALLGMAGYFAGVVQAPMTAFVIILEMTGNHDNVIALMLASMLGYGTARMISHEPLYHALSRIFIAEAIRRRRAEAGPGSAQG
ncbi:chloride channel protein [Mesorhizobium sp. M7A.F.Ca.MR.362.00.0.0]|uniref:chloride channel protein n=2 Tax=unclassified Mesorhizobium TaxID=325217 RepID=UPI000FD4A7F7|nr:chloride channel protein [Mesorhizobium sp. M7A.F.Ca.MR.362.00.0.0]RUU81871.1 chloride channel protein [Mesorhizobium sp. M7A.F.Ca.MR.362.00.0.0]RWN97591.1 MAG: chloride channel protein [Mesorhizobium sp.]